MGDNDKSTASLTNHADLTPNEQSVNQYDAVDVDYAPQVEHQGRQELAVYKRRWWVMLAFSWCSMCQSLQWNTWSPILDTVLIAYGWSDSFVALLPAFSNAGFILFGFLIMYITEIEGELGIMDIQIYRSN